MQIYLSRLTYACFLALLLFSVTSWAAKKNQPARVQLPEKILQHADYNTAEAISGEFIIESGTNLREKALNFISDKKTAFKIEQPSQELRLLYERTDGLGLTHLRFAQEFDGLEVWGCQTIIHFKDENTIYLAGGQTIATPEIITTPGLTLQQASELAYDNLKSEYQNIDLQTESELLIYPNDGDPKLAYLVTVTSAQDGSIRWRVFVDAQSGQVIHQFNDIHFDGADVGSGVDVLGHTHDLNIYEQGGSYQLRDVTHVPEIRTYNNYYGGGSLSTDPDGDKIWDDNIDQRAEVSAHYYSQLSIEYFSNTFGRESYDGLGTDLIVNILPNAGYNNAYWNGQAINFGEGDGTSFLPFSGALDVVAHELAHGVTEYNGTGGLIYQFQSGALNESYSDVFGAMVDRDDWLVGEDIALFSTNPFIRSMVNPNLKGHPMSWDQYIWYDITIDNGGVHINSGIPNHACYLASDVFGVTREKVEQIWYRTLTNYLTPTSGFHFWAAMTLQSAADLYGPAEVSGVYDALKLVGLLPTYSEPENVVVSTIIGQSATPDTIWVFNEGQGDSYDFTINPPSVPGLSVTHIAGANPIIQGDSASFEVALSTTGFTECDLGVTKDTIDFSLETGVFSTTVRVPAVVAVGKTGTSQETMNIGTSCVNLGGYNTTEIHNFSRSGQDALYDGTLMIGLLDGTDTTVYKNVFGTSGIVVTDTIADDTDSKSFEFAVEDGRIQGRATYRWDSSDPANCDFIIADFSLYNPCDTDLTILTGAYCDFDLQSSGNNTCQYDVSDNLVYMQDGSGNYAVGMALLNDTPRNLRSISNPDLVWDADWTDGIAYQQMALTSNNLDLSPNDYSALLTFGQNTIGAGDTLTYSMVYMYHISGSDWFDDILTRVNAFNTTYVCGDFDGEEGINLLDVLYLISYLYDTPSGPAPDPPEAADVNNDGDVNLLDILSLISYLYDTPPGTAPNCP